MIEDKAMARRVKTWSFLDLEKASKNWTKEKKDAYLKALWNCATDEAKKDAIIFLSNNQPTTH